YNDGNTEFSDGTRDGDVEELGIPVVVFRGDEGGDVRVRPRIHHDAEARGRAGIEEAAHRKATEVDGGLGRIVRIRRVELHALRAVVRDGDQLFVRLRFADTQRSEVDAGRAGDLTTLAGKL